MNRSTRNGLYWRKLHMSTRYLFGPVGPVDAPCAAEHLDAQRAQGRCRAFAPDDGADVKIGPRDRWADILDRLPADWRPDFVVLQTAYCIIPECLWDTPVPVIVLASDWNLLW